MKIIPAIDIIGGKTVRLKQGRYEEKTVYDMTPVDAAREWESMGAEMIHVIDLEGAKEGHPVNLQTVGEIARAVNIPIEVGGGFRKEVDIKNALNSGVWRVVVGSKAFDDLDFARDCLENFKSQVILSVDAEGGKPRVYGWLQEVDVDIYFILEKFASFGAKEIIFTEISRDGTLSGPNVKQVEQILDRVKVSIISAGGIKTVDDVKKFKGLEKKGLSGVIIGKALYEGTIDLREAIDAGKEDNPVS